MTKYALIYENLNGQPVYTGSFVGKNHYRIKFIMYRYLKKLLTQEKPITFAIQEVKTNKFYVYVGKTEKIQTADICGVKISSINKVSALPKKQATEFRKKLIYKTQPIPYTKTHEYREDYDSDETSLSETDSEFVEES